MVLNREEGLECEVYVDGVQWSMHQNLNTWDVFWLNQVLMRKSVVGRWQVGGGLQILLGLWLMIGVCSLNVLGSCLLWLVPVLMYGSETRM